MNVAASEMLGVAAIMAVSALLRFYDLSQRGLIYWDEAKYALEGIRLKSVMPYLLGMHADPFLGKAVGTAKPTHAFLIGLAYELLGTRDYAPLFVSAACSLVEVLLIYLIARRLFTPAVGFIAALLLAVSEYDALYARSALSESDASVFLLGAVLLWLAGSQRATNEVRLPGGKENVSLLLAGALMGLGFTTNYRLLPYIAAIVGLDLVWCCRRRGWRAALPRLALWLSGIAVAPLLWQLAGALAQARGLVLFESEVGRRGSSYLSEALYQLHEGKQSVIHFNPLAYVQWYVVRQSWPSLVLLVAGLALTAWRRTFPWLVAAAPVIVPYLLYTFAPFVVPRNMVIALPFASLLAAAALVSGAQVARRVHAEVILLLALTLVLAALGTRMTWRLTAERSGFAQAAAYIARHDRGCTLSSSEIMAFYLRPPPCRTLLLPLSVADLPAYIRAGYRYAVLENHHNSRVTGFLRSHTPRIARYLAVGSLDIGESPISSENTNPPRANSPMEYVDLFRLDSEYLYRRSTSRVAGHAVRPGA